MLPVYIKSLKIENIQVAYYFRLYFHPKTMLREMEELSNQIKLTKDIGEFFDSRQKNIAEMLETGIKYKTDVLDISIRIEYKIDYFKQKDIEKVWKKKEIMDIFEMEESSSLEALSGNICSKLIYDRKYKLIGGILPTSLPLPKQIESKVGQTTVNGLHLTFKESPIGLEKLEIKKENDEWELYFVINTKVNHLREFYPQGPELIISISKFFMEEPK